MLPLLLLACAATPDASDPCDGSGAASTCLEPVRDPAYYVEQSQRYFDTMDYAVESDWPAYAPQVARWEWPPWLKLTAFGRDDIEASDTLLALYPSTVPERDCRAFDTQPFGRCKVVFRYDAHEGRPCPIYEEFTFDDQGEVTFIEAWSDLPGLRPMADDDPWAEADGVPRLSSRVPGLGTPDGEIDLDGPDMGAAAEADPDVADFVFRAHDWTAAWLVELQASGGDAMWVTGCGWSEL